MGEQIIIVISNTRKGLRMELKTKGMDKEVEAFVIPALSILLNNKILNRLGEMLEIKEV